MLEFLVFRGNVACVYLLIPRFFLFLCSYDLAVTNFPKQSKERDTSWIKNRRNTRNKIQEGTDLPKHTYIPSTHTPHRTAPHHTGTHQNTTHHKHHTPHTHHVHRKGNLPDWRRTTGYRRRSPQGITRLARHQRNLRSRTDTICQVSCSKFVIFGLRSTLPPLPAPWFFGPQFFSSPVLHLCSR